MRYPPLPQAPLDAKTGRRDEPGTWLFSRPWAMWFQQFAELVINLSTEVTGTLSLTALASQAAGTLLGRNASTEGTPEVITLGAGLVMTGTELAAVPRELVEAGDAGTWLTIDWARGPVQRVQLTDNVTLRFANPTSGARLELLVATGAGGYTVSWPTEVVWAGGTAPTVTVTASVTDWFSFVFIPSQGCYLGTAAQNYDVSTLGSSSPSRSPSVSPSRSPSVSDSSSTSRSPSVSASRSPSPSA